MQEIKKVTVKVPQAYLDLVNQIFEIEKKATNLKEENSIQRNINKMNGLLEDGFFNDVGLSYHNPLGEDYSDTRTDCEATISGLSVENLEIIEVIKPIIFYSYKENEIVIKIIAQPAVVIVQSKNIHQ
ncbi:hypothetical protein FLA105534_04296 [Flavobacterium bizetiae]|uniref:Uncharacterized protein n=1 Tax=Flavobacterium bizetiae TaxID=2704140 RepID=A0A6J4GVF1_9FLAO|nr:hypothetical protein [Flavobacterium bizetiae]CAA9202879.1 hypothetical protein FLA105534_04296 [Flavobacterium bizetiae]CAD5343565.1 hypothetical protein FLA105535_03564 [Flavobacterium bizetiae]CAD5349559.1 hypothetical protein FLA105534_03544 [Flavobacterium bizetiae]